MPRRDIIEFLRDPVQFSGDVQDAAVWREALEKIAKPLIDSAGDSPLRPAQERAWEGLASHRAGLVLGPPGTGKTYLLSWLIAGYMEARRQAGLPCRVFVSAFTRNAVGNLLEAVAKRQARHFPTAPAPIYLGNPPAGGLNAAVQLGDDDAVWSAVRQPQALVGGTVWGLYRLLNENDAPGAEGPTAPLFDLVCIDEASQMVLGQGLMALAGLAAGGRIVVAGDDKQLPPVRSLRSTRIGDREVGGSLYAFMKSAEAAEFALDETFRLNGPLTAFPERMFYPGAYRSADPDRRLPLAQTWREGLAPWLQAALDPELPIVVFLHDGPSAATSSPFEARLAARLIEALHTRTNGASLSHFWNEVAAVVSPHRAQNALIRTSLPDDLRDGAFVETVDRIQGKERDLIVLSYCVSDPEFALAEGDFIFSPERLNVAITRGRSKLVLFVSRRLLEAAPNDQETMDKLEVLREFVFSCEPSGRVDLDGPGGARVETEIRTRGFKPGSLQLEALVEPEEAAEQAPQMTADLELLLEAIRRLALRNAYGAANLSDIRRDRGLAQEPFEACRELHRLGRLVLRRRDGKFGSFWTAAPLAEPRRVYESDLQTVRERIEQVVREARKGALSPFYDNLRDSFVWMSREKEDALLPVLQTLEREGLVVFGRVKDSLTVNVPARPVDSAPDEEPPEAGVTDDDFQLLNRLEDNEARRINFGIFDGWSNASSLAHDMRRPLNQVIASLGRLEADGHLMFTPDGVRSRMAELAREVRYAKQRFRPDDASRRPYLVRSLKVELRDRDKPVRSVSLQAVLDDLERTHGASEGLRFLGRTLRSVWGETPKIAGFQERGLRSIFAAWRGEAADTVVISADTGSGKTEAALLPMIAAAIDDRLAGVRGVRAVLAYPRVRLVANQAQRLAGYLAALERQAGAPTLTLGLQVAQTPRNLFNLREWDREAGWESTGPGRVAFPFFDCPACKGGLDVEPGGGGEADALICTQCDWRFNGWIGSKDALIASPPDFFLPTTDSLHRWLHEPGYGPLFGDVGFAPPRAFIADEIHLYTHVHGAQVGMALRRLAARIQLNSGVPAIAVGMSATLGDPAKAWRRLTGRTDCMEVRPEPAEQEVNPRGREYFYFVQPEVESRGKDVAGPSTTIQTLMCLSHGMRRRTDDEGGFRSLVFLDSIDKLRRLHSSYLDAEEGQELSALRTGLFGDDAAGRPVKTCCGAPDGCDRFGDGECWWFAAQDKRQRSARGRLPPDAPLKVASTPIYSGTGGSAEKLIKGADVVFATSSLEVGYDDPDITLVYQHYAPANLASFIQRKGRGGRGLSDRPTTAVTLSLYSPRDSWWFRRPEEMISPKGFETPLNPDNFFVRRGQALCALLDGFARRQALGRQVFDGERPTDAALEEAELLVEAALGAGVWPEFGCPNARAFWDEATKSGTFTPYLNALREQLDWAPNLLFDTVNLPSARVRSDEDAEGRREDISLLLPTIAPGNATRRFHGAAVHWRPPVNGRAPWLDLQDYKEAKAEDLGLSSADLLARLPSEARAALQGLESRICRPVTTSLVRLGRMMGAEFTPEWRCDAAAQTIEPAAGPRDGTGVHHESRGYLRGFLLVQATGAQGRSLTTAPVADWVDSAECFLGGDIGSGLTGLQVSRVYWGADAEVRVQDPQADGATFSQIFVAPTSQAPLLHGYKVETEGLRLQLRSERLDAFVQAEMLRIGSDDAERRWRTAQFMRYLVESRAQYLGLNVYEARRGADLLVAAAGHPDLRQRLQRLLSFWSPEKLQELLQAVRRERLSQHPMLSEARVKRTAEALGDIRFRDLIRDALQEVQRPGALTGYLRSVVLHSLAIRLRDAFVALGRSEARRVLMHIELPLQFEGLTDDLLTLCESGASGDGATRGVVEHFEQLLAGWTAGDLSACPNAAEDATVARFWAQSDAHARWREADPRSPATVEMLGEELGIASRDVPASILRLLFGRETAGLEEIDIYDLGRELEDVRSELETELGRRAQDWEFAGAAVARSQSHPASTLGRLHAAYGGLGDAVDGESLGADARLADQAYKIGARLCLDGCRACVHQSSDLMSDSLVEVSVSRELLGRFLDPSSAADSEVVQRAMVGEPVKDRAGQKTQGGLLAD